jgi:hypothetical protein
MNQPAFSDAATRPATPAHPKTVKKVARSAAFIRCAPNDKAHPRRPLVRRNAPKNRNAAAVGCSDWFATQGAFNTGTGPFSVSSNSSKVSGLRPSLSCSTTNLRISPNSPFAGFGNNSMASRCGMLATISS